MPSYDDVLLVVNDKSPASLEIGEYFKAARHIPDINVVHVSMTDKQGAGSETGRATATEKQTLLSAIKTHMTDNNLIDKINYIVLTRGIPMYAESPEFSAQSAPYHLTDVYVMFGMSESAADSSIVDIFSKNKYFYYYNNDILNKKFSHNKFGYYIVSRLDGPGVDNIKKMIDDTGYPAYESYTKNGGKVKYLTLHQMIPPIVSNELLKRTNIEVAQPPRNADGVLTATMDTVAKDVMFAYFNNVNFGYASFPGDNNFYGDGDIVSQYPFIYRGATFLPGSFATCFRSHPSRMMNRDNGGLLKVDLETAKITDYQKAYDGSDIKFRQQTCVAYDPINNQVWCGTGEPAINVSMSFDGRGTNEMYQEHMRNEGGGIAIYNAENGDIINWINANDENSPLNNNRVVQVAYDPTDKYMWVAHYKGIQYYDLVNKTWHEVIDLKNDCAAAVDICIDKFDTDKIYCSFYSPDNTYYRKVGSQITGAATKIFEYSKQNKTVTPYEVKSGSEDPYGNVPQLLKTSATTLWTTRGYYYYNTTLKQATRSTLLLKYNLTDNKIEEKIILDDLIPEIKTPPADLKTITLDPPRCLIAGPDKTIITSIGCRMTYTAKRTSADGKTTYLCETKNYVIRVTENTGSASTVEVVNDTVMNATHTSTPPVYHIRGMVVNPADSNVIYIGMSWPYASPYMVAKSLDGGKSWAKYSSSSKFNNVYDLTINNKTLYAVRGYQSAQNLLSDFMAFGLNCFGGGIIHENMIYNPSRTSATQSGYSAYGHPKGTEIYSAGISSIDSQTGILDSASGKVYSAWNSGVSYNKGDEVSYSTTSAIYRSIASGNLNNYPTGYWKEVDASNIPAYSSSVAYRKPDLVKYNDKIYMSVYSHTGNTPDSSIYWQEKDITAVSDYSTSASYSIADMVTYKGKAYIALVNHSNQEPGIFAWEKVSDAVLTSVSMNYSQTEPMMFLYLDGFSIGEVRLGTQSQYPQIGGGGYTGHMLVFEPKCAPFAPRVDEANMSTIYKDRKIEIPLVSPGLPLTMDGFIPETINSATVKITDESDQPYTVDSTVYDETARKIIITGNFTAPAKYSVTLKCGIDGIKNVKGASLTNTRPDEFKEDITYRFGDKDLSKSDLTVTELSWLPTNPFVNNLLTLTFKIVNDGNVTASAGVSADQRADIYLDGEKLTSLNYDDLQSGDSVVLTYTIQADKITDGNHTVKVVADADGKISESDETEASNSLEKNFTATLPLDLVVSDIVLSPSIPAKGQEMTVEFNLKNSSAFAIAASTATIYLDGNKLKDIACPALDANTSAAISLALDTSSLALAGHIIKVVADSDNKIVETDETDVSNSLENNFTVVMPSDLTVSNISLSPAIPLEGQAMTISFNLNNSNISAVAASVAAIYFDNNKFKEVSCPELAAGASKSISFEVDAKSLTVGAHLIKVIADADNKIYESDETEISNSQEKSFAVLIPPDLKITDISLFPENPVKSQNVTVAFTVSNNGGSVAAGNAATVYLDDNKIGDVNCPALTANTAVSLSLVLDAVNLTVGTHTVKIIADDGNNIYESDDNNNLMVKGITVNDYSDLLIKDVWTFPQTPVAGKSLQVFCKLNNIGYGSAVSEQTVDLYIDDVKVSSITYSNLAAKSTATLNFTVDGKYISSGLHKFKVVADGGNVILESRKDNNSLEKEITVTGTGDGGGSSGTKRAKDDFNGRGASDILWQNNDGVVGMWTGSGSNSWTFLGSADSNWEIVGSGDFNSNGKSDILWQNKTTGYVGMWDGGTTWQGLGVAPRAEWEIVGVGDFNSNGKSDILWQNKNDGTVGIWESGIAWQYFGNVPRANWEIVGVGDFNGNGKSDVLWQNKNDGTVGIWESGTAWQYFGNVPRADWEIVGVGDFNGNGKSDVLWQNKNNGYTGMWESGATWQGFGAADRNTWKICNRKNSN